MNLQKRIPEIAYLPMFSMRNYRHRLYTNYHYTDLVREKLCERGAFWIVERIFALQKHLRGHSFSKIQHWDLKTLPDGYAMLTCTDKKTGEILFYDHGYSESHLNDDLSFVLYRNILQIRNA